jgi:hypothetical protein
MNAIAPRHPPTELAAQGHHHQSDFKAIDPAEPLYPCTIVAERHLRACFEIQTSVVLFLNHGNIAKAAQTCDRAVIAMRGECYQSLGRDITSYAVRDPGKTAKLCDRGNIEYRPNCYVGAAKALVDWTATTDNALEFCRIVSSGETGSRGLIACYLAVGEQIATLSNDAARRASECARASGPEGIAACRRGARL